MNDSLYMATRRYVTLQTGANGFFADYNNCYNPAGGLASSLSLTLLLRNNS